jgi:glyoxylase-like metal-dependent hydrolase (beta-lactamase superfamily II)
VTRPHLDRRQFFSLSTAALAGAALTPPHLRLEAPGHHDSPFASDPPSPGFYRFELGDLTISVLGDGFFHLSEITPPDLEPLEVISLNVSEEMRQEYFGSRLLGSDDQRLLLAPVLIESGDRRILVDTGWAIPGSSPTAGRLNVTLEVMGVAAEDIDTIILTHGHPDHLGGLLEPDTGEPSFPNAEVIMSQGELEFWTGDEAAPLLEVPILRPIPDILDALRDRIRLVQAGAEAAGGIRTISSPGHTPGHMCLGLEAGGRQVLLTGDAIVNVHSAFERPDWHNFFDIDPEEGGRTRRRLLDQAVADEMLILGYHFPFPGLGYALRDGDAYRWNPAGSTLL